MKGVEFDPDADVALRMMCHCGARLEVTRPKKGRGAVDLEVPVHICLDDRWVVQIVRAHSSVKP